MSLKCGDGKKVYKSLFLLFKVFVLLGDKYYARANLPNLLMWCHASQQRDKLPFYDLLMGDASCFNEPQEAGEISFSLLARACIGDTQRRKLSHMEDMYILSNFLMSVKNDITNDVEEIRPADKLADTHIADGRIRASAEVQPRLSYKP